ncbi:MAG: DNA-3-methyladenine glycosylase 2 family protein [Acidobacteriia bacterium]|jgi:DNA-3-methyladenine glycosylase II|nr:DNA-3-methyladenine glycosylase 2 family protein [Terriglobia bacterium]
MRYIAAAVRHLKRVDPVLARVIARVGQCRLAEERERDEFSSLAEAILYQQLALKAAQTISSRFQQLYASDGRGRLPTPMELLRTPRRQLRAAGVSRQKIGYLRDLAAKAAAGVLSLGRFSRLSDEEVIANVTQVKGIGRWTAEMFLIFCLGRRDVLPVDDLGLQHGFRLAYGLRRLPSAAWMIRTAEPWRPYRTIGTWYLWALRRTEV